MIEYELNDDGEVLEDRMNVIAIQRCLFDIGRQVRNEARIQTIVMLLAKLYDGDKLTKEEDLTVRDVLGRR